MTATYPDLPAHHVVTTRPNLHELIHQQDRLIVADGIRDIDFLALRREGIRHLVFDIENTLEPIVHGPKTMSLSTARLLGDRIDDGFNVVFATNSRSDWKPFLEAFAAFDERVVIPYPKVIQPGKGKKPRKPQRAYFREVLDRLGTSSPDRVAMIGDKLRHDCFPALRAGFGTAVWVRPLGRDVIWHGLPVEAPRRLRERMTARWYGLPRFSDEVSWA